MPADRSPRSESSRPKSSRPKSPRSRPAAARTRTASTSETRRSRPEARLDIAIAFPGPGRIRLSSRALFSDARGALARRFIERAFLAPEVEEVEIDAGETRAEIRFRLSGEAERAVVQRISRALAAGGAPNPASERAPLLIFPEEFELSREPWLRLVRHGQRLSSWSVKHEIEGRIRFHNPALFRRPEVGQAVERELMNALGVDRYSYSEVTATVLVRYDPRQIQKHQLIELLDDALVKSLDAPAMPVDLDLPVCTASAGLAAVSTFLVPALSPVTAAVFLWSVIPSFRSAYEVLFKERRLGVDVLDAIVVTLCLLTNQVLAGTVLAWSLAVARKLVKKTEDDSKKMLLNVFGKQPRFVWLHVDGVEVETALEKLQVGDEIIVHTGETVPVDGTVVHGMAMIDQHTLTGESAPAEKVEGDQVYASTTVVAGKVRVAVTSAGDDTTSAKLAQILTDTAGYKLRSQSQGEELADKAVAPTLALGALGLATRGINSAVAIVNCDLGTGIRMAAPIGMLTSLTLCAEHGILVKDGRALELIRNVDTFLFDKTGTLTRERPEVGRILTYGGHAPQDILKWAAAAERKFSHPIAKAILEKARADGLTLPDIDDSKYHVGYGISVVVDGHTVRVGSARFMKHEGVTLPRGIDGEIEAVHDDGNSLVLVGVDDALGGAIELVAAERPEAAAVIAGLRARGAKHLAIISGDHEQPTRKLAEKLGMDRSFAEVLPQDKAKYVELLQKEGRTVCFIGDGVNDSIALKKANVSISLRGASSIATDTAQVVFMEDSLAKLLQLRDVSEDLQHNINRSWGLILVPNIICIGGAFFGGFGVMHSMVFNQIGGLLALGNGLLPLRKVNAVRKEKELRAHLKSRKG